MVLTFSALETLCVAGLWLSNATLDHCATSGVRGRGGALALINSSYAELAEVTLSSCSASAVGGGLWAVASYFDVANTEFRVTSAPS